MMRHIRVKRLLLLSNFRKKKRNTYKTLVFKQFDKSFGIFIDTENDYIEILCILLEWLRGCSEAVQRVRHSEKWGGREWKTGLRKKRIKSKYFFECSFFVVWIYEQNGTIGGSRIALWLLANAAYSLEKKTKCEWTSPLKKSVLYWLYAIDIWLCRRKDVQSIVNATVLEASKKDGEFKAY